MIGNRVMLREFSRELHVRSTELKVTSTLQRPKKSFFLLFDKI